MEIPASLRRWFVVHALVDVAVAVPLLLAPESFLRSLGWATVEPISARLVAAALLAIGLQSWFGRAAAFETYRAMLNLKLIWSAGAIVALLIGVGQTAEGAKGGNAGPDAAWVFLALFVGFFGVWFYYRVRMKQIARMEDLDDDQPADDSGEDGDVSPGGDSRPS